jgi:hypothetical protein
VRTPESINREDRVANAQANFSKRPEPANRTLSTARAAVADHPSTDVDRVELNRPSSVSTKAIIALPLN